MSIYTVPLSLILVKSPIPLNFNGINTLNSCLLTCLQMGGGGRGVACLMLPCSVTLRLLDCLVLTCSVTYTLRLPDIVQTLRLPGVDLFSNIQTLKTAWC